MRAAGPVSSHGLPAAVGGYSQSFAVPSGSGLLFVSGQIPVDADGVVPRGFEAQCRQVWRNVLNVLGAVDLDVEHLVKVTIFLGSRDHIDINGQVRREILGSHQPALTVLIADIFDPEWLVEIEAVAKMPAP